MKLITIALLAMVATIVMADPCTRIKVSDHDGEQWVEAYKSVRKMKDPTALAPSELDLGMDGINPKRMAIGWTPAYVSTNGTGAVYSKFVDKVEVEMTDDEKASRDAEFAAEHLAAETEAVALVRNDHGFRLCIRLMRLITNGRPTDQEIIDEGKKEFGL